VKVLIAADETDGALRCAATAERLFPGAEFFVVHVGDDPATSAVSWGAAFPVAMPMMLYPPVAQMSAPDEVVHDARDRAAEVAELAHLDDAGSIGTLGDTAEATLRAARTHDVDVVVVGSHERSWFARLINGSVTNDVVKQAHRPILVVK
jgi:nucleotide-binding universal stress UspA family protein